MDEATWKRFMKEIQVRDVDFICEQGGRGNNHPGNRRLHQDKLLLVPGYDKATNKVKYLLASWLAQTVFDRDGRFVEWDEERWEFVEVSFDVAYAMCTQKLRCAKRKKKKKRKNNGTDSTTPTHALPPSQPQPPMISETTTTMMAMTTHAAPSASHQVTAGWTSNNSTTTQHQTIDSVNNFVDEDGFDFDIDRIDPDAMMRDFLEMTEDDMKKFNIEYGSDNSYD